MVDAKKLKEKIAKTAEKAKKTATQKFSRSVKVEPHKHCRVCYTVIPLDTDPRVCGSEECEQKNERDEKNQKMMRIMFVVFVALFFVPLLLKGFGIA